MRKLLLAACAALILASCAALDFRAEKAALPSPAYPATSFAVFSDPHLFLPELGIGEPAFERFKSEDRKIFEYSTSLLAQTIARIQEAHPRFVLVTGDLSKDGEEQVHIAFAKAMEKLTGAGIPVYVVPGNHDVNNPGAVRFEGDRKIRIPNVSPGRFAEIYRNLGYGAAIERDPHSLAYVVEPEPGLWLLAMDACRYDLSLTEPLEHTGGAFLPERLAWVKKILERARAENKAVIAMMHHGVVEHFSGQKKQFPDYLVRDSDQFSRMLADYGVRIVFTGHFHSQNIAGAWWDDNGNTAVPPTARFVYDIETGSLVSYPCPYRLIRIDEAQVMHVRSFRIDSIPEIPTGFPEYTLNCTRQGMLPYLESVLRRYGISREEAERIATPLADAAIAHYAGDPKFQGTEMYPTKNLSFIGSIAIGLKKDVIEGMWNGKPPHADNMVDINLRDGTYSKVE